MTIWVIQNNLLSQERQLLWLDACKNQGIPYVDISVIPFSEDPLEPYLEKPHDILIPYGSTSIVKQASKQGWKGCFFDFENYRTSTWIKHRDDMLNQYAWIAPLKVVTEYMRVFKEDHFFVRPNNDLKSFGGHIVKGSEFAEWIDKATYGGATLLDMQEVVVSSIEEIQAEIRCFVVDHKVVSASFYRVKGQRYLEEVSDPELLELANEKARLWLPHPVTCMDLAIIKSNECKVVEFNCFNCTGEYKHDIEKIVREVTNYCARLAQG